MKREDFIFTIGYDGDSAVVDSRAKKKYGSRRTAQLLEEGFFKPALCSAIYSGNDEELKTVLEKYNLLADKPLAGIEQLKLVLGVHRLPDEITKTVQI